VTLANETAVVLAIVQGAVMAASATETTNQYLL